MLLASFIYRLLSLRLSFLTILPFASELFSNFEILFLIICFCISTLTFCIGIPFFLFVLLCCGSGIRGRTEISQLSVATGYRPAVLPLNYATIFFPILLFSRLFFWIWTNSFVFFIYTYFNQKFCCESLFFLFWWTRCDSNATTHGLKDHCSANWATDSYFLFCFVFA